MAEAWTADLMHADELGVGRWGIARGAIAFVVRRGPNIWCRRRWGRTVLVALALLIASAFIPPWFLLPTVVLGLLAWFILAPSYEGTDLPGQLGSPHTLP